MAMSSGPRAAGFVQSRGAVVSRGARLGVRSGAIVGGALGTVLWPVGGTVFGALAGAVVGVFFGLGTGGVLSLIDVGSGERARVRWAAAFAAGTGAALFGEAVGLPGSTTLYVAVACGSVAAVDAPRVAFGPRAPWLPQRQSHGGSTISDALDWAAGGVTAGLGTGAVIGAVRVASHPTTVAGALRSVLDSAAAGVLPGLVLGSLVGLCVVGARRRGRGRTAQS